MCSGCLSVGKPRSTSISERLILLRSSPALSNDLLATDVLWRNRLVPPWLGHPPLTNIYGPSRYTPPPAAASTFASVPGQHPMQVPPPSAMQAPPRAPPAQPPVVPYFDETRGYAFA
ncbi:hypothetical protein BV20DRAFT_963980 [Pilatotrama ljubarskyi]|nr:hypothetical protein BV20DRAFT_963980 [Pilatotrama ljubarskyi]